MELRWKLSKELFRVNKTKLDILYVISIQTHGNGGHFHSLNHISRALSKHYNVGIISIGRGKSKVLNEHPYFLKHIRLTGYNIFGLKKEFIKLIQTFNPTYINCFDWPSLAIIGAVSNSNTGILCHTKCGGPNTAYNFVNNLVLFSKENLSWFNSKPIFKNSNIALIPNRVKELVIDNTISLKKKKPFTFIAISRIGAAYTPNLKKAIRLIKMLGAGIELVIIGTVEENKYLKELQEDIKTDRLPVRILTNDVYTNEASRYIRFADAFIGSGRGVMEACSLKIPVLSNAKNVTIPILLDETSFDTLFEFNFSPRSFAENDNEEYHFIKLDKLVKDKVYSQELGSYSNQLFNSYFKLDNSYPKYEVFYNNAKEWNYSLWSNRREILRALYRFWKPA